MSRKMLASLRENGFRTIRFIAVSALSLLGAQVALALTSTTTTLSSSATSTTVGQSVTLTANVSPTAATGTVTFKDGTTTLGTGSISAGKATLATSFSTAGSHSLTAVYAGNTTYATSTSGALTETVSARTTTTVLTSSVNPASVAQSTTLTATITGTSPTGTVTFKDGATTLGTATVSSGVATLATSFAGAGSHSLTAVYGGNANNLTSTSAAVTETVNARSTSTVLTSSINPAGVAQSTTLTATVTGTSATGTVTFKDGTTTLGAGPVTSGVATLATSFATAGAHSLTAVYGGNANNLTSTSAAITETVNARNTTTVLTSSVNPATVGQNTTLTATVTGTSVTGTVTFKDGAATLGTGAISSGVATLVASFSTKASHSLTAVFGGDSNNLTSTSTAVTETVNARSTTTVLTSSVNPAAVAQSTTLTATITGTGATGTVTFKDGTATLGTGTVSSGVATLAASFAATGAHSLTAVYGGDTNNLTSTSSALNETVNAGATTTVLASSVNPASVGQSTTLTATVIGASPSGTVTFKDGATTLGTGTLASGVATLSTSFSTAGSHSLTAVYAGNSTNLGSTSAALTETINAGATTTALTSSVNPSSIGQSTTLTATVTGTSPTGAVTFKDGATTLGTGTVSAGVATLSASFSSGGAHSLTAVYGGDANNATSTSAALAQTVNGLPTTATLASSVNPSSLGQSTTLTATVAGASVTGTVTFKDGAATLGTGTVSSGVATFSTTFSAGGAHSLTAVYGGDANNLSSTSTTLTQTVNGLATTTALTSSVNPAGLGQSTTLTATVTGTAPSGAVTFKDGTATLGTGTISGGVATLATSFASGGVHGLTAVYGGDANNLTSTSSAVSETVQTGATATTIVLAASPTSTSVGQSVSVTATVSPSDATGTVTFMDGGTTLGMAVLSAGAASSTVTFAIAGSHNIVAIYGGNASYAVSGSNTVTESISARSTTLALSSSLNPATVGQNTTLTATLTGTNPTGTVAFKDGATTLGTGTVSAGVATLSTVLLNAGARSLSAVYSGDANNLGSASSALTETVNQVATTTAVVPSVNPARVGQIVTYTATVTGVNPTGTVTFRDGNNNALGVGTIVGGSASVATSYANSYGGGSAKATYNGDANNLASVSATVYVTVNAGGSTATTSTLGASLTTASVSQNVTLTATISPASVTGTVTFMDGSLTTLGTAVLDAGVVSLTTSFSTKGAHSLTAVYGGDDTYAVSTSGAVSETITARTTTTGLTSSINPIQAGQPITLTAAVTGTYVGGQTVTFKDGAATLGVASIGGPGSNSNSEAAFATSLSTIGAHSLTAVYGGDANNLSSTSAVLSETVNTGTTTTVLTSSISPVNIGQSTTLTATVSGANPGGTVTFKDGATTLGTGTVSGGGVASLSTSFSVSGVHSLTAVYGGDANNLASTSSGFSEAVAGGSPVLALVASRTTISPGQIFTLTATATPSSSASVVGDSVHFYDGATDVGSATIDATNTATLSVGGWQTGAWATGSHSVTAKLVDANYPGVVSPSVTLTATSATPTITISSNRNPANPAPYSSNPLLIAVNVTGMYALGTTGTVITLRDGGTPVQTYTTFPYGDVASFSFNYAPTLSAFGVHNLTATIDADSWNAATTSANLAETIGGVTTFELQFSGSPVGAGQSVVLSVAIAGGSTSPQPTGTVTFKDGATVIATVPVSARAASTPFTPPSAGTHILTASYSGDGGFTNLPSSATAPLNVTPQAALVSLSSNLSSVAVSAPVTLTAVVNAPGATGTVSFGDEATSFGTATISGNSATLSVSMTTVGPHRIGAIYSGDASNAAGVSDFITIQVGTSGTPASPGNMTWLYGYDAVGSLITAIDPNANATQKFYDTLQRNSTLVQPLPAVGGTTPQIQFGYDGQDNLTSVKDPRNLTTSYTVNGLGSTAAIASPDSGGATNTYDAGGNLKTFTDARGKTATISYDALNRPKSISYTTGTPTVFEYDGGITPVANSLGKLSKVTDESGSTTYTYDGFGNVATKTSTIVSAVGTKSFTVTYTWGTTGPATGKLASIKYPSGSVVNYGYDATERLGTVTMNPVNANGVGTSGTTVPILSAITYNGSNAIKGWSWSDGTAYQRTFDSFGRLTSYPLGNPNGTGLAAGLLRTLNYDSAARIIGYTHTRSGVGQPAFDQTFGYDGLDRLIQNAMAGTTYGFSYDQTGNRTTRVVGATTYVNTVSPTSNQLATVQTAGSGGSVVTNTYVHDAAGNLTGDGGATYAYGSRGRMTGATVTGGLVSYLYNGFDQRTSKTGPTGLVASGASYFAYDEAGHLLGEYDANLTPIYETAYIGSVPVAVLEQTGSAGASTLQTTPYNVWADHIDTPRVVTRNTDQALVWRWDTAEAFGSTVPDQNPNSLGAFALNQRFPGQVYDGETGLIQNGYRYYDSSTGRYRSFDPIGLAGGINPYAYVSGNPLGYVDPLGLDWSVTFGGYAGAGGQVTFGTAGGNGFMTARVGLGLGGGFSYNPNPSLPGPAPDNRREGGVVLSCSAKANFNAGPLSASLEKGAARNYNNDQSSTYGGASSSARDRFSGIGASGSIGGQITIYSGAP